MSKETAAENVSYDIDKQIVIIKFPNGTTTTMTFGWIKKAYFNITRMEEHCIKKNATKGEPHDNQ